MDTLTNFRSIWQSNTFFFPYHWRFNKNKQKEIIFKVQNGKYVCANEEKNAPHHKYMYFIHNDHIYMSHIGKQWGHMSITFSGSTTKILLDVIN